MKMVGFGDLADSKLILHRAKTNRRNSKLLAFAKIMDKAVKGKERQFKIVRMVPGILS